MAAGSTGTFCTGAGGQMYGWGKLKTSGDTSTSPQPVMDLSGWNVRCLSCGPATFAVAAETSVITWGAATNGELGLGAGGKKSSANPVKVSAAEAEAAVSTQRLHVRSVGQLRRACACMRGVTWRAC